MTHLIACDPGLDEAVFSVFHLDLFHQQVEAGQIDRFAAASAAWVDQYRFKTRSKDHDELRVMTLVRQLVPMLLRYPKGMIVVEHPTSWSIYRKNTGSQVARLALGLGAIEGALEAIEYQWQTIEPSGCPDGFDSAKSFNRYMVERYFQGRASRFTTQDQIDAAWIGMRALSRGIARASPTPAVGVA